MLSEQVSKWTKWTNHLSEQDLTRLLLYGDVKKFSNDLNTLILSSSIGFITSSKRFDEPFM